MINEIPNIPENRNKRIVIVGGGFAGLKILRKLASHDFQIILIDKNNYHQFQPLLYQVATAGLEPSAISFPFRKIIQNSKNIHYRIAKLNKVEQDKNEILTDIGRLSYDYLVLAMGTTTNYFGQKNIEENTLSMKTSSDAIFIRNTILENFEHSLLETDHSKVSSYLNIVLVGGGPTGVELAGAFAEMKKYILPKEYPELDLDDMHILLFEASPKLLAGMSDKASKNSLEYLMKLGVEVRLNTRVEDYNGSTLFVSGGETIETRAVVWAAGVSANGVAGIDTEIIDHGNRIKVDRYNRMLGSDNIYVIGDQCIMNTPNYPQGHPQVAQAAIQQAINLYHNIIAAENGRSLKEFEYRDKGSMATIGRNLAVADLPFARIKGFFAWVIWSVVHLFTIFGLKNRVSVFLNWMWSYLTYDQSLRILLIPKKKGKPD